MTAQSRIASEDETNLRYWLANEDWYPSRFTRRWLERTPPAAANDALASIAQGAQPEPRALWSILGMIFANSGLATSTGILGGGPNDRKAGTRAALLLAERGDWRGIAPLVRVFSTGGFLQNKYQANIEATLIRFLHWAEPDESIAADIRPLVQRLQESGTGDSAHAELFRAAVRYLSATGGEANDALLKAITKKHGENSPRTIQMVWHPKSRLLRMANWPQGPRPGRPSH